MNTATITTFIVYLVGMLALGFIAYRVTTNLSDYILGGRRLGVGVAALSAGASDMSGWLMLGLPGAMYAFGMNQVWIAVGICIGAYLNWQVVAARLRRYTELAGDALTLPDYFENRFRDRLRLLRFVSAVVILVFFTFYVSAGMVGGAILFRNSFGFDYTTSLLLGTSVVVAYTFLGGFLAVSWTDVVQGTLMFLALILVPVIAIGEIGGWDATVNAVGRIDIAYLDVFDDMTVLGVASLMAWGLGYFGQPHILARFMAIRSDDHVPMARLICTTWTTLTLFGAVFVGFVGIGYYTATPLAEPETVFISLTQVLFNPWIAGCLLAAILAAIMSTIDSQLLVCSSVLTEDFYRAVLRRKAGDKELVWVGRFTVLAVAIVAALLASSPESTVLDLVAYAWGGLGSAFGPIVILSLLWPRTTRNGALAGIVVGAVTVIVWAQLEGGIFDAYELLPGFVFSAIAVIVVSLLDRKPPAEIREEFARV